MVAHSIYDTIFYDRSVELADMLVNSAIAHEYHEAKQALALDQVAQEAIHRFQHAKEEYEEAQRFGKYHPDYQQYRQTVLERKRELDLLPTVVQMKRVERELEQLLYEIAYLLSRSISTTIKVPSDDPILNLQGLAGCGGSCASGGCTTCGNH